MIAAILILLLSAVQFNAQHPSSNCPDQAQFQQCIQCSFNFWDRTHICICDNSKFQILNLCIEPSFPCKLTSLSSIHNGSSGNIFNKWDNQIAPFWIQTLNQTYSNSTPPSPLPSILNNFNFNNMSDNLKNGWTQAYYFYLSFASEIQDLDFPNKRTLVYNSVNEAEKLLDKSFDEWWDRIVSQINSNLNEGYDISAQKLRRKLSFQIQLRMPCHGCAQGYFLFGNESNSSCAPCPNSCSVCANGTCLICADNYFLNNQSICQYSGLKCPNKPEFSQCYECMIVKNEHSCTCPKNNFSFLGKCIPQSSSCKSTQLNSIYESSSGNIYNLWHSVIAPFWSLQLQIIKNLQLTDPTNLLNNFDFNNMNFSLRRGWTQAYYFRQSFAVQVGNLTDVDKINLYNRSINLAESLLDKNIQQWWGPTLNLFNEIAGTSYTPISFQNLVKIRMLTFGNIPCHFCKPQFGLIKKNGEQGCQVCLQGCIQCYQNNKICTRCAQGYTQHCPQYTPKCQITEKCVVTASLPSKLSPIDNIWFVAIIIIVFAIIIIKRYLKKEEYEKMRRGDDSPSQIIN